MSLLLDALNRADQERKRNEATPGIDSNHEQRVDDESRQHPVLLIVAIIIGVAILAALVYLLGQRSATPVPAANVASSAPKTAANKSAKTVPAEKTIEVTEPTPEVEKAPAPDESVTSLYQQTQVPDTNTAITISTPQGEPAPTPGDTNVAPPPPSATTPTSITQYANLPELHNLPKDILERVPTLTYSEHHYSGDDSSVKINGNIFHVNDQIANGIVIDRILEDGMILNLEGHPFKMRAMNSWINM